MPTHIATQIRLSHPRLILASIVFMFVADGVNSVLRNSGSNFYQVSVFVRTLVQAYFLFLLFRTNYRNQILWMIFFLMGVYLLGTIAGLHSKLYTLQTYNFFENFKDINKLLFSFICWFTYRAYFRTTNLLKQLFTVFEALILTQSIVIITSFVFDLSIFSAYYTPERGVFRFGYQGLIPAQNEISAFFLISFFYFLNKVVHLKQGNIELLIVTFASLLTGTKVTLVLPVILFIYGIKWLLSIKIHKTHFVVVLAIVAGMITTFLLRDKILEQISITISYFDWQISNIFQNSYLSIFLTGRDYKLIVFILDFFPKFNFLNYLFGGHNRASFSIEMDVFDIFARLGLVGGIGFYYFYFKMLLFSPRNIRFIHILFVIVWLGVSATAGHLVFSAVNGSYLPILLVAFSAISPITKKSTYAVRYTNT